MVCRHVILTAYWFCFALWSVLPLGLALPVCAEAQSPTLTEGKPGVVRNEVGPTHQVQADLATKNVLILHAFEANVPINVKTDQGLRAAFEAGGLGIKNQFFKRVAMRLGQRRRNPLQFARSSLSHL